MQLKGIALAIALSAAGLFSSPVSAAVIVAEDFRLANDCVGSWAQDQGGFETCMTPAREGYSASPVIAKYDVTRTSDPWEFASWAGPLMASYFAITLNGNGATGSWSYDPTGCAACALITSFVVKAGPSFRWYRTDPMEAIHSGTWATKGGKSLSHITFYGSALPPAPVPLPAAGLLLAGALAGLGLVRRRKA